MIKRFLEWLLAVVNRRQEKLRLRIENTDAEIAHCERTIRELEKLRDTISNGCRQSNELV